MILYYVIATGKDCDGHAKFQCEIYADRDAAVKAAEESNLASDGIVRSLVGKDKAIEYVNQWERELPDWYYNEKGMLVPIPNYIYIHFAGDPSVGMFAHSYKMEIPIEITEDGWNKEDKETVRRKVKELYEFIYEEERCTVFFEDEPGE